jgi:hypothetical protein
MTRIGAGTTFEGTGVEIDDIHGVGCVHMPDADFRTCRVRHGVVLPSKDAVATDCSSTDTEGCAHLSDAATGWRWSLTVARAMALYDPDCV